MKYFDPRTVSSYLRSFKPNYTYRSVHTYIFAHDHSVHCTYSGILNLRVHLSGTVIFCVVGERVHNAILKLIIWLHNLPKILFCIAAFVFLLYVIGLCRWTNAWYCLV